MNIDFHVLVFVDIFKLINTHYVSVFAQKNPFLEDVHLDSDYLGFRCEWLEFHFLII